MKIPRYIRVLITRGHSRPATAEDFIDKLRRDEPLVADWFARYYGIPVTNSLREHLRFISQLRAPAQTRIGRGPEAAQDSGHPEHPRCIGTSDANQS